MASIPPDLCLISGQHPEGRAGKHSGALRQIQVGVGWGGGNPSRPNRGSGGVFSIFLRLLHTEAENLAAWLLHQFDALGQLPLALAPKALHTIQE